MEHWAQLYELWSSQIKAGADLPFQQEFFVNFYQSFLLNDRWMQYLQGLGRTLQITVMALIIGVILGVAVAVLRTAHDQQRVGQRSMVLGIINTVCKLYKMCIRDRAAAMPAPPESWVRFTRRSPAPACPALS